MARSNYLIKGLSGTGKTSVREELLKRGYDAIEADTEFGYYEDPQTGLPTDKKEFLNWKWNKQQVEDILNNKDKDITFVCGGSMNDKDFLHLFTKVFTLFVDDETLKQRLLTRLHGNFRDRPEDLARILEYNKGVASRKGLILVDATKPIEGVVDTILGQLN